MSSTRLHLPIRTYTHCLTDQGTGNLQVPYGYYKYNSEYNDLPGGLFHFIRNGEYVPTLQGLTADYLRTLKDVAVCATGSSVWNRPFLNAPHMYEVELINTGHESLRQGDRFTVQLPNKRDVHAQVEVQIDPGYDLSVNKNVWGGFLATRRVNHETGGDPVEEMLDAISEDDAFDVFDLISPYTPHSVLAMMALVANGGGYMDVPERLRVAAAIAVNEQYTPSVVETIVADANVKRYLRTVLGHALTIAESVQGFASGQVIRACTGYTNSTVNTGSRFMAQLNTNRWLS